MAHSAMTARRRPATLWMVFCLACFEIISAVPYGLALTIDPSGALVEMPTSMLGGSPFADFRIPGLILLVVIGFGAALLATALFRRPGWKWASALNPSRTQHWAWSATIVYGFALMTWIATEVIMIGCDSWLQPFHFCIGLVFAVTPLTPSMRRFFRAA